MAVRSFALLFLATLINIPSSCAQMYYNPDLYLPDNFFSRFYFDPADDPTHGFVDYQTYDEAVSLGLAKTFTDYVQFGADDSAVGSRGRKSVRLEGYTTYTKGLLIADILHMPENACGAWPAFWTLGPNWPHQGEIDIVEGVNFMNTNQYTLHSDGEYSSCTITSQTSATENGTFVSSTCDVLDSSGDIVNPSGCSIDGASSNGLMDNFNSIGGGVYVMQWTDNYIKMWFFPRNNIPESIVDPSTEPNICEFGQPDALFAGCSFGTDFTDQQIVISNTFCGDWANNPYVYPDAGTCPESCVDMVTNYPEDYQYSYWQFASIRVWSENPSYQGSFDSPVCTVASSTTTTTTTTTTPSTTTTTTTTTTPSSTTTTTTTTTTTDPPSTTTTTTTTTTDPSTTTTTTTTTDPSTTTTTTTDSSTTTTDPSTTTTTTTDSSTTTTTTTTTDPSTTTTTTTTTTDPSTTTTTTANPSTTTTDPSTTTTTTTTDPSTTTTTTTTADPSTTTTTTDPPTTTTTTTADPSTTTTDPSTTTTTTIDNTQASPQVQVQISPDETCGIQNGYTCPDGQCCSQYGWCGTTYEYCGQGCQIAFGTCQSTSSPAGGAVISNDATCGGDSGFTCPEGECCSQYGWCGSSAAYCGNGCQNSFSLGTCSDSGSPNAISTYGQVSYDGTCGGAGEMTCAGSMFGQCCSKWGYCGNTGDYCGDGCQSTFGSCS